MTTLFVDLRHDLVTLEKKIGIPHQPCQTLDAMYSRIVWLLNQYYEPEDQEKLENICTLRFALSRRAITRRYRMRHGEKVKAYTESHREQLRAYYRARYRKKKERQQEENTKH